MRAADGLKGDKLYATYEGVVYDVTSFAEEHPGGCGLLRTAAGLDLGHFFANYTVRQLLMIYTRSPQQQRPEEKLATQLRCVHVR